MIRLNRWEAYGLGILLAGLIYLSAQGIFFAGTSKAKGTICRVSDNSYSSTRGYSEFYYACFTAKDSNAYKVYIGSNKGLELGDSVMVIYKISDPLHARAADIKSLWLFPSFPYIIVWGILMALITGAFYGSRYLFIQYRPFRMWTD